MKADASTAVGRDVVACVADSERFFAGVLRALLADCEFDGGHMTTCVTAKSSTGGRLLGEIAPRRPHPPDGVQRSGRSRQPRVGRGDRRPGPGGPRAVVGVLTLRTSSCSFSSGVRQGGRGSGDRGEREKEERGRKRRKEEAEKEERGRERGRKRGRRRVGGEGDKRQKQRTERQERTGKDRREKDRREKDTNRKKTEEREERQEERPKEREKRKGKIAPGGRTQIPDP